MVALKNLLDSYARVMRNKSAAGIDETPVEQLKPYLQEQPAQIKESLLNGTYQPNKEFPKSYFDRLGFISPLDQLWKLQFST
ncbi:MAG: hypothetical protein AB7P14_13865 [Blastocatellales bacterium]